MRNPQRMTSTKVKRESELSFGIKVRLGATSLILPHRPVHARKAQWRRESDAMLLTSQTRRLSGPNLFRILAYLKGLGVAIGELVDGRLELRALTMLVAPYRAADTFALDRH